MYSIPEAEVENPPAWAVDHVGLIANKIRTWHEQNARCCYCHEETWLLPFSKKGKPHCEGTAEHIIPKSQGGKNNYFNIVMACRACNTERDLMDPFEYYKLRQNTKKHAEWRAENARALQARKAAARTRRKKRWDDRWQEEAREFGLRRTAYKDALEDPEMIVWDAYNILQSTPWTIPKCLLLKSSQPSLGKTASNAQSSKSLLSIIASWLSMNQTSRCQSATR